MQRHGLRFVKHRDGEWAAYTADRVPVECSFGAPREITELIIESGLATAEPPPLFVLVKLAPVRPSVNVLLAQAPPMLPPR